MRLFKISPGNQAFQWLFELPLSYHAFFEKEADMNSPEGEVSFSDRVLMGIFDHPNQRC